MSKTLKQKARKIIVTAFCIIMVCIIGMSTSFNILEDNSVNFGMNTVKAETTKEAGWQPGDDINDNYHLLKTITPLGDGLYDVDIYAANIEHAEKAEVFVIWDNSNSMNDLSGNWYSQERSTILNFLCALRPNFTSFSFRLSDFGGYTNNGKDTGWVSASNDNTIYSTVTNTITDNYHWSASKFDRNLEIAKTAFSSTSDSTVRIVLLVCDGVVSNGLGIFSESRAKDAISHANELKKYATIFTAAISGSTDVLTKKGTALMSQLATEGSSTYDGETVYNTPYTTTGSYSGSDYVNLENFVKLAAVSDERHFREATWVVENFDDNYFTLSKTPVVTTQKFLGKSGFSTTDVSASSSITYLSPNEFKIYNLNLINHRCYLLGNTPYGNRIHIHYQLKAKDVSEATTVYTSGETLGYIDWYSTQLNSWVKVPLAGMDVTLTPSYYYVVFQPNGGTGTMPSQTIPYGAGTNLNKNTFTNSLKLTYVAGDGAKVNNKNTKDTVSYSAEFKGWSLTAGGTNKYLDGATVTNLTEPGETANLYAKWQASTVLPLPVKDNYIFEEWNTNASGTGVSYDAGDLFSFSKDITLYAMWSAKTYEVSYDLNGGTNTSTFDVPQTGTYGTGISLYSDSPTKTGYTFVGWTTSDSDILTYDDIEYQPGELFAITDKDENVLHAVWKGTITASANGGYFEDGTELLTDVRYSGEAAYETQVDVSKYETPTRDGYYFEGWNSSSDGTGTVLFNIPPSSQTIYAKWRAVPTYNVEYNSNGGTDSVPTGQIKTENVPLTLSFTPAPEREGYKFVGWSEDSMAITPTYTPETPSFTKNEATTLYAVWDVMTYNITYDANTGEGAPTSHTKTYNINITLKDEVPMKAKYTFLGWATDKDAKVAEYQPGETYKTNSDLVLFAVWEKTKYMITYDYASNGGTSVNTLFIKQDPDEALDISPVAVKKGWDFIGWSLTKDSIVILPNDADMPEKDITVYAVFKKTLTANFSSNDTYNYDTKTDTPIVLTTDIYNNETYGRIEVPEYNNINENSEYVKGEIQEKKTSLGIYTRRDEPFSSENMTNEVIIYASEGTLNYDAVYSTSVTLHFDSNGGSKVNETAKMPVYETLGVINKVYAKNNLSSLLITETIPTREGYTFGGWAIPDISSKYQRYFSGDEIKASVRPSILNGDITAYAQWISASITSKALTTISPNQIIEYTVKAELTGDSPQVQLLAEIPENTELVTEEGVTSVNDGKNVLFTIQNVSTSDVISKTFHVKIKDTVKDEDKITAGLIAYVDYYKYNSDDASSTTDTLQINASSVTNTVGYKYTVTYNKEAGETGDVPVDSTNYRGGLSEKATLKTNTLSKEGYTFVGWLDTDKKVAYKEGAEIPVTHNVNLKALWGKITLSEKCENKVPGAEIEYTVDIELPNYINSADISEVFSSDVDVTDVKLIPIIEATPSEDKEETEEDEDKNKAEKYTVSFDISSNAPFVPTSTVAAQKVIKNSTATKPTVQSENGYSVAFWYVDNSYDGTIDNSKIYNFNSLITEDITLYAIWEESESITYHTVTVHMGDHGEAIAPISVVDGTFFQAPSVPFDGKYYVCCWYKDNTFTDINNIDVDKLFNFNTPITSDTDIYACWTKTDDTSDTTTNKPVIIPASGTPASTSGDTVSLHLVKIDNINKYKLVIKGKINDNAAPGTEIKKQVSMTCSTGYEVESNEVTTQVGYLITYIIGDNFTTSLYSDGSIKYSGDDVIYNTDKDGNTIYYQAGEKAVILTPVNKNNNYFIEWNTSEAGTGAVFDGGDEVTISKNLNLFVKNINIKQEITDKQTDYIPGEEYQTTASVIVPYDGIVKLIISGQTGVDVLEIINNTDEFIKDIKTEDDKFIVTVDAEQNKSYDIIIKARVNSDALPETQTGCDIKAVYRDAEYNANEDNIDINNYYTVTYDINGGTGTVPVDATYYRNGEKAKVLSYEGMEKFGYAFDCWNTKAEADGDCYDPGNEVAFNKNTTVYAIWRISTNLPHTGSQGIAIITFLSILSIGLYLVIRKKNK